MNREQKRNLKRAIKRGKINIDKTQKAFSDILQEKASAFGINKGDKVKLDYEKLTNDPNFPRMNEEWKRWIEDHKNTELTVDFDENHTKNKLFCVFVEDESDIKWLFYVGDLIKLEPQNDKKEEN